MAVSAKQIELEVSMDANVARLEAKTDHIQSDVTDIKAELRRIEAKFDGKVDALDGKIDAVRNVMTEWRLELKDELSAIRKQQLLDKLWWLVIAGSILGVMARGMKWI